MRHWKICQAPDCSKKFAVDKRTPKKGPKRRRYCSPACVQRAYYWRDAA